MRLMSASLRRLGRLGAVAALMMTLAAAFPHSVVLAQVHFWSLPQTQ